jgi:succinyl-CoA synthetase beta subunit
MKIVKDSAARAATLLPEEGEAIAERLNQALADVTADPGVDTVTIENSEG